MLDFSTILDADSPPIVPLDDMVGDSSLASPADWREGLLCTIKGVPYRLLVNAVQALRFAPEWMGVLAYDQFANATVVRRAPPWIPDPSSWTQRFWTDADDLRATEWLQRRDIHVAVGVVGQAVEAVSREAEFHPVREYLDGLEWDRIPRIGSWLREYAGAPDTPYTWAVGSRWLISAIARVEEPGCKADHALILEGAQGVGKSSAIQVLARPWFADRMSDLQSKDAAQETSGVWIVEMAELDNLRRKESASIKAFLSRSSDRFRPPYGRRVMNVPRQCVFAGTINPEGGYLRDPTGARRFWPVACGKIDIDALARDRDQLWAEARERYFANEPWWLATPELEQLAADEQADRFEADPWLEEIENYVNYPWKDNVSKGEVLHALGLHESQWNQRHDNRVAACLSKLKWERYREKTVQGADGKPKRPWRYRRVVKET